MRYTFDRSSMYRNPALGKTIVANAPGPATPAQSTGNDILSVVLDDRKRTQAVFLMTVLAIGLNFWRLAEQKRTNKKLDLLLNKR